MKVLGLEGSFPVSRYADLVQGETLGESDLLHGGQLASIRAIKTARDGTSMVMDCLDECALGDVIASRPVTPVRLNLDLPARHPFDAPGAFGFLAARAIDGVEAANLSDGGPLRYARSLTLPHGPSAMKLVATRDADSRWFVRLHLELASLADLATAVTRARRIVDLGTDPIAVDVALAADPALAPLVARTPGIRVPGTSDPHELVVRAIVGQQISVAAARGHLSRLAASLGTGYSSTFAGITRHFPSPAQIAAGIPAPEPDGPLDPDRPLRLPRRSVRTVLDTARALADGTLVVNINSDPTGLHADLVARPGIGPWTAAYVAMRVLGDPDTWLDGDVALIAGASAVGVLPPDLPRATAHRALARHAVRWSPWRSYAAMHLWAATAAATLST